MEQRTTEWYQMRLAKFTASEFHKLMTSGRGKDQLFGKTALGYINDKVAEIVTNGTILDYKKIDSKSLEWGNTWEPEAKEKYFTKTGRIITDCGFFEVNDNFGASPDGLVNEDGQVEIKCPYDTANHIDNIRLKTVDQFIDLRYEYYIQVQIQLMATGRKWCDFVSYDPRCIPSLSLSILRIFPDEKIQNEIKEREEKARAIMNSIIKELFQMC
jgi:hypothetical protein